MLKIRIIQEKEEIMKPKRDTLVIMCSGPQDMNAFLNFTQSDSGLGLGKEGITFDLLAIPGCVHSLNKSNSILFVEYLRALEGWINFLVNEHKIKRIILIDHPDCAWFEKLTEIRLDKEMLKERLEEQSREFIQTSKALKFKFHEIIVESYKMYILEGDDIRFEKIEI